MGDLHLDPNELVDLIAGRASAEDRARIESHVDRCPECMQLMIDLGRAATSPVARTLPLDEEGSPYSVGIPSRAHGGELSPGDVVDHYEVERLLGRGGMGEVYRAHDVKLGRRVALKLIHPMLMLSTDAKQRFENEARATAKLNDPHIVTIHGVGEYRGRPYVALEYIEGKNLREQLLIDPPSLENALGMGLSIARAVAAAHAQGVIHRDLKPENVIVDRSGRVRVVDFGLAKIGGVNEDGAPASAHGAWATSFGGTPLYMAPEQWRLERAGAAADVWALGVILYELCTGRHPFTDPQMTDADPSAIDRLRGRVTESTPPVPSDVALLPPELNELIVGCLDKDPAQRPRVSEIVERLRQLVETRDSETQARPRSPAVAPAPSSRLRLRRRSRWASAVAFVAVLIAVGAVVQVVRLSRRAIDASTAPPVASATPEAPAAIASSAASPPPPVEPSQKALPPASAAIARASRPPTASATAKTTATAPAAPVDELCTDTPDCRNSGLCREHDGACVGSSDADCRRSLNCVSFGNCALKGGRCVPTEPDHCRNASRCASWGMCSLAGGRCSAVESADCRASSECKTKGLCTAAGGWCVVGSSADCAASTLCKTQGKCTRDAAKNRCVE